MLGILPGIAHDGFEFESTVPRNMQSAELGSADVQLTRQSSSKARASHHCGMPLRRSIDVNDDDGLLQGT